MHDLLPGLVQLYGITGKPRALRHDTGVCRRRAGPGRARPGADGRWRAVDRAARRTKDNVAAVKRRSIGSQAISVGFTPALEVPALFEDVGPRGRIPHAWEITTGPAKPDVPALLTLDVVADSTARPAPAGRRTAAPAARRPHRGPASTTCRLNLSAGVGVGCSRRASTTRTRRSASWRGCGSRRPSACRRWPCHGPASTRSKSSSGRPSRRASSGRATARQPAVQPAGARRSIARPSCSRSKRPSVGFHALASDRRLCCSPAAIRGSTCSMRKPARSASATACAGESPSRHARIRVAAMRAGGGAAGNLPPRHRSPISPGSMRRAGASRRA